MLRAVHHAYTAALSFIAASLLCNTALACSYVTSGHFEMVADPSDDTPPASPKARVGKIKRGFEKDADSEGCGEPLDSCHDLGFVEIDVTDLEQDAGVVVELAGTLPAGLESQVGHPVSPTAEGLVRVVWVDGKGRSKLDFEVIVWSVDRAGNMSESPVRLRVKHGGDGCNTHAGSSHAGWLAALCTLLFVRRLRRGPLSM